MLALVGFDFSMIKTEITANILFQGIKRGECVSASPVRGHWRGVPWMYDSSAGEGWIESEAEPGAWQRTTHTVHHLTSSPKSCTYRGEELHLKRIMTLLLQLSFFYREYKILSIQLPK